MNRFPETQTKIDQFPVPWSSSLPSILGDGSFNVRRTPSMLAPCEWLGIVSSHERKNGFAQQDWQDSLHSALQLALMQGWGILVAGETPYADVVLHACKRLHVPYRTLIQSDSHVDVRPNITLSNDQANADLDAFNCGVLELAMERSHTDPKIPMYDVATVFLSDRLFVVTLRSGGKISQLLARRLSHEEIPVGTTYLSLSMPHKSSGSLCQAIEWLDRGAIGWLKTKLPQSSGSQVTPQETQFRCRTSNNSPACPSHQPIFPMRLLRPTVTKFLIHCTRARRGPWPDQSVPQFHDELLQYPWDEQPTALMTLQRILKQQRLIATNHFRRGNKDTVCFASKKLSDLLSMRRFQSHLARWDWEPYGIMIDQAWLESHDAKKVSYVDRNAAKKLNIDELSFCQVVSNEEGAIDWRQEQEWRIVGDVRLNQIPFSKAVVFVPTQAEAFSIQPFSRWPIVVCSKS